MLRRIDNTKMGSSNLGWLKSKFHFSFADYYNPSNINFGTLRVINDDLVEPGTGFDTHSHKDMEIISYIIDGALTHGDSMGNKRTLSRGHVQYMSAGTGVFHSEHNLGNETLRFLQLWIIPNERGYEPIYGDYKFEWDDRINKWLNIVSSKEGNAEIKINQDSNIFALELDKDNEIEFKVGAGRQAYLVQIEGTSDVNNIVLNMRDGLEITEEDIKIKAIDSSHFLVVEMSK